jgi:IgGFc binding protein
MTRDSQGTSAASAEREGTHVRVGRAYEGNARPRRGGFSRRVAWGVAALGVLFACGERRGFEGKPTEFNSDAGGDPSVVTSCEGVRCSRDFRKVVDGCDESRVLAECPADQGCNQGKCVPACAAAADSTMGCEFAVVSPPQYKQDKGSCFGAIVANVWGLPTRLEASYGLEAIDVLQTARLVRTFGTTVTYEPFNGELQPGEVAAIFLSEARDGTAGPNALRCPKGITPAIVKETGKPGTYRSPVFQIKTTVPVSAYSFYPFGTLAFGNGMGNILLPRASWQTEYVATSVWNAWRPGGAVESRPGLHIVAAEDETEVTLVGSAAIEGKGTDIPGALKGAPVTYRLNRAEQLQLEQEQELSGSLVRANKPIGLWSSISLVYIPDGHGTGDGSAVSLFPLKAWGSEYALVPYHSRTSDKGPEDYVYRVTAAVDDTVFAYEPARPADAPVKLSKGQVKLFSTREPFIVKSQDKNHPFIIHSYMTGQGFVHAVREEGDPEFALVVPPEQYLGRYIFWVEPHWPNAELVVIRAREEGKEFKPVTLDCAGELGDWKPLGASGKYEYTRPWLINGRKAQPYGDKTCGGGRREVTSDGPVGVTVWGTGFAASYAYPAGAGLREINNVATEIR